MTLLAFPGNPVIGLEFGAVMLLAVLMLEMAGATIEVGVRRAVLLEKPVFAGVVVWGLLLEVEQALCEKSLQYFQDKHTLVL